MKKLLFALMAVMAFTITGNSQVRTAPTASTTTVSQETTHKIHLRFGRPSKNCLGFGICFFDIDITVEDVINIIEAITKNGKLEVRFSPDAFRSNQANFSGGYLVLEEDFKLSREVSLKIMGVEGYVLRQGKYPVVFNSATNTYNCTF